MAKLKTHQATAKRIKISKKGKFLKRAAGQDHFNARESGVQGMNKRRDVSLAKSGAEKIVKNLLPYN